MANSRNSNSAANEFFDALPDIVALIAEGRGRVVQRGQLFKLTDYVTQVLYLRHAEFPLTAGPEKVATEMDKHEGFVDALRAELEARKAANGPDHSRQYDEERKREYASVNVWWWAVRKLDATLVFTSD